MEDFKKRQIQFTIQSLGLSIIFFGIHSYLLHYFGSDVNFFFPVWQIYVFHYMVTLILYTVINYKFSLGQKNIFNSFMIFTFLKMILAIIFLLPLLLSDFENKQPDVFNFFILYFMYLFFEVFSISKFILKSNDS